MIKVDHHCTVKLTKDSLISGASPRESWLKPPLTNVYTKNLNDGTDSTLSSFADNNKYREAVSVLEGRAAIQMDYNRLEKGLT